MAENKQLKIKPVYRSRGFTLIEALISMLVFTVLMLSASSFFTSSKIKFTDIEKKETALELANNKLEFLKASAFDNINSSTESITINSYSFDRYTTVISSDGCKIIKVIVAGMNNSIELQTILSD